MSLSDDHTDLVHPDIIPGWAASL